MEVGTSAVKVGEGDEHHRELNLGTSKYRSNEIGEFRVVGPALEGTTASGRAAKGCFDRVLDSINEVFWGRCMR